MATVYEKRGVWYIGTKDCTGRRKCQATKARSKTEARCLARDLEAKADRQQKGLEAAPGDNTMTLAELVNWWLKKRAPGRSIRTATPLLRRHVVEESIGGLQLPRVTSA